MELPKNLQKRLGAECRLVANKIQEEDPSRQLYFFSAIYADISRALNTVWDKDLALLYTITQITHERISGCLTLVTSGRERGLRLDPKVFELLPKAVEDLAQYFEGNGNDEEFYELLRRFAELSYAATGNGSYLIEKGLIKL